MLVLTRKSQEQIKIGDQVTVTILRIKGSTVRVGIQAPRDVRVVRGELPKEEQPASIVTALTAEQEEAGAIGEELTEPSDDIAAESVISFRLKYMAGETLAPRAEATTRVSAAHLPLRRMHDRFGSGPLKQLVATCAMLDT